MQVHPLGYMGWTLVEQYKFKEWWNNKQRPNNNQKDVVQHICNNFETIIDK